MIPRDVLAGVEAFNAGDFFEAHELWEDHWGHGPLAEREATLGLIKAAVALHHLKNGNETGFQWQAREGVPRLRTNAHVWPDLGLLALAEELDSLMSQARFHGRIPDDWEAPRIPLPS